MDSSKRYNSRSNPKEKANVISKLFLWWLRGLFREGYSKELQKEDLYKAIDEDKSELLGDRLEKNWYNELKKANEQDREPSLFRAIVHTFWGWYAVYGLVLMFQSLVVKIAEPLLLGQLLMYFGSEVDMAIEEAYMYAGGLLITSFVVLFVQHHYALNCYYLGMRMRIACCALLYRKVLRLNKTSSSQTTTGHLVNMMSNDVARFDQVPLYFHYLWVCPIQVPLIMYIMWQYVGVSSLVGLAVIFIQTTPVQVLMGKMTAKLRLRIALRTDERVRLMSEIIAGIQVIKMYTWEKPFSLLVELARKLEIKEVTKVSYLHGLYWSFMAFAGQASLFATLTTYVLLGNNITASKVYTLSAFFRALNYTLAVYFPNGIALTAETSVSIKRFQNFLLRDEISKEDIGEKNLLEDKRVVITSGSAKWSDISSETLRNVDLTVQSGELVAITGAVGAGKSSLLHVILQELPLTTGSLHVGGRISYASQEPWLFSGSIRQNILFGQLYDQKRYQEVIEVCAIQRDIALFPYGDRTVVGERGMSLSGGQRARISLARAVYKDADIYLFDDPLSAVDAHVGRHVFEACITDFLRHKTRVLVTHQLHLLKHLQHVVVINNGIIKAQGSYDELLRSEIELNFMEKVNSSGEQTTDNVEGSQAKIRAISLKSLQSDEATVDNEAQPEENEESRGTGAISWSTYRQYFQAGGNACFLFVVAAIFISGQVASSGTDFWLSFWTQEEESSNQYNSTTASSIECSFSTEDSLIIYGSLIGACIILTITRSVLLFQMCMKSSMNLHHSMFANILRATMHFFDTNSSGRILNRFSKDIGAVDEMLPTALLEVLQVMLQMCGVLTLILIANYWMVIPMLVISFIFYFIRIIYLATARDVKRLEGITQSPVYSHLSASMNGLTTIRANDAQEMVRKEFDHQQDLHTSAWLLLVSTGSAFGIYLDCFSALFTGIVTFSFLLFDRATLAGQVGLGVSQAMVMTGVLQFGIRQSAEVVSQMTAVERVLEYNDVAVDNYAGKKAPKGWPSKGEIKFRNLSLKYNENDPPVLKNLNITIAPNQKVGIVGRTGAGKTSLISALFRLAWQEGEIIIDGIDTREIVLDDLRSAVSIIPQEPVLFSGTIRINLDPLHKYDDHLLWNALEEVELKDVINSLDFHIEEGGGNLSVGQRQLVCLARAILKDNKILVLDEATANVDTKTDALIQSTIRRRFSACTILTVAHRLNTIMDSDIVIVMEAGSIIESDRPHLLLQKLSDSFLWRMVQETGPSMASQLCNIAQEAYEMQKETTTETEKLKKS